MQLPAVLWLAFRVSHTSTTSCWRGSLRSSCTLEGLCYADLPNKESTAGLG